MGRFNKTLIFALVFVLAMGLCGCGGEYKDGIYTAEMPEFSDSGWRDIMELEIQNGEITRINWDAVYIDDTIPIRKKQYSKSGLYGMLVEGAVGEWYDQAIAIEQYVIENGVDSFRLNNEGRTDTVAGCTIHVNAFERLVRECLEQAAK